MNSELDLPDTTFRNPTAGSVNGVEMLDELVEYCTDVPEAYYHVTVGTDSKSGEPRASFASALAVHRTVEAPDKIDRSRVGRGARFFYRRFSRPSFNSLRERIYEEAEASVALADAVEDRFLEGLLESDELVDVNFEVHVDIGEYGPTSDMINEILAYVRSNGYNVERKPDAYSASHVADQFA